MSKKKSMKLFHDRLLLLKNQNQLNLPRLNLRDMINKTIDGIESLIKDFINISSQYFLINEQEKKQFIELLRGQEKQTDEAEGLKKMGNQTKLKPFYSATNNLNQKPKNN